MSRVLSTMKLDVQLQQRNQLYVIGIFVAVLLGGLVRVLFPVEYVGRALAAFYLLGLGGTTFMFGASMLLLEKGEGTLSALRTTMLRTSDYVLSKAVTLTGFALVESAIVYAIASRGVETQLVWLVCGALVLGVFYTLVGLGLAAAHDAVTSFLLPSGTLVSMVLQLPVLSLVGVGPDWLWYLVPTRAPLLLLQGAFEPLTAAQGAYAAVVSLAMIAAAWAFCLHRFRTHVRFAEGAP